MAKRIVLPGLVFDALHIAALANGGIGRGVDFMVVFDGEDNLQNCPVCAHGLLRDMGHIVGEDLSSQLQASGVSRNVNDGAVRAICNRDSGPGGYARKVTFEEWCAELNVVRGEA